MRYNNDTIKKALPKFYKKIIDEKPINLTLERWETYIDRSRQVIELRLQGKSLLEISKLLEISRERVRQIEIDIVKKIKKSLSK